MTTIDPLELQRLIDGELDFEQTQRLLNLAESNPDSWRLIASGFVENQVWELGFADDPVAGRDVAAKSFEPGNRFNAGYIKWFSLAAMVLLAASVAFLFEDPGSGLVDGNLGSQVVDAGGLLPDIEIPKDNGGYDLNQIPAMYNVQLQGPDGNTFVDTQVPLYTSDLVDAGKWLRQTEVPEQMRRRFSDSGYGISQDVRYIRGQLKDGRNFLIPVRNYRFSPDQ